MSQFFLLRNSSQKFLPDLQDDDLEDFDATLFFFYDSVHNRKVPDRDWPTKIEFYRWLDVYIDNFIQNRLVGNKTDLLTFDNQKKCFFSLVLEQYHKYGKSFLFTYISDEHNNYDFIFLHTLFALKHLGYLDFKDLERTWKDITKKGKYYASEEAGYKCKITFKETGIEEINKSKIQVKQECKTSDNINVQTLHGVLKINKRTGNIKFNSTSSEINPESQELKTLVRLIEASEYTATYKELLLKDAKKTDKRALAFVIRNIKKSLSILPTKKAKNKDVIKNIKNYGYRLLLK